MRSLFVKIFLWFWVAMTLIATIGIVLALTTDHGKGSLERHRRYLIRQSTSLIGAYEQGGPGALHSKILSLERKSGHPVFLFRKTQGPLGGIPASPDVARLAHQVERSGTIQFVPSPRGLWVALPVTDHYVFVTELKRPSRLERILNPHRLTSRLIVTFLVTGLIAYLLARSLSAPIRKLRQATQQFAGGDLSTRVGDGIRGQDDIADLAREFDQMAERIEDLIGSQRRLVRDVSHELRSPLARLNVALALARKRSGEGAHAALNRIEREAERLNEMIGQLLSLNLLESRSGLLRPVPIALEQLVGEVVEDADFEARNRKRSVVLQKSTPFSLTGSRELLRRAIENVVRNALRHTAEGTAVEVSLELRPAGTALVRVRDHGPGVPAGELPKIFQPFYRVEEARDRESGGTGIGLAITERAVHLHGGSVTAVNAPDGGLQVEIELPEKGADFS